MTLERLLVYDKKFNVFMDVSGREYTKPKATMTRDEQRKPKLHLQKMATSSVFTVLPSAHNTQLDDERHLVNKLGAICMESTSDADSADPRLIIGACYSMRSTLQRLMPDRSTVDGFHWDTNKWRLIYHQSATGWKFVAVVTCASEKTGGMDHTHVAMYYEQIFVPAVINSPLYYREINTRDKIVVTEGLARSTRLFFAT